MQSPQAVQAARIKITGVVQGVGFRPFVFRLARKHNLRGWVRNTSGGVEIEVEGNEVSQNEFYNDLLTEAPPASRIEKLDYDLSAAKGYTGFEIRDSRSLAGEYQLVSTDIATCEDCRKEIFDPADRRYRYPFTNCTNCGPRFTIIEDIPYDRPNTTMRVFKMCPACQKEYDNPLDRRFHAQPNACPVCGPRLILADSRGNIIKCDDIITRTAELLKQGKIIAIRGLGGFQLACDATNEAAVNELRTRKYRPAKPFAVMVWHIGAARMHCEISGEEAALLQSPQAPIVLLKWLKEKSNICPAAAPDINYMGVMLPYTPLHHLLMRKVDRPLVMTSGNLSEEPIARDNDEALRRLKGIADYFLLHDREIYARYDDSVLIVEDNHPKMARRARGYAPYPIILLNKSKQVLACGGEEKNTFCLTRDNHAFLSQHIGDMENEETLEHFENTVELYKKLFRIKPEIMACDMHPEYLATKYAKRIASEQNLKLVPVQHHHAHIVSCLAENKAKGPVIGVAFDGTGYGTDGAVWGGEFLIADRQQFTRAGHLQYLPLPGGAAAIRKPYRTAMGYIYALLGEDLSLEGMSLSKYESESAIIKQQLSRGINSPLTSSAGRLFDAVSALLGVREEISYEGQAAIELEMLATDETGNFKPYPFSITEQDGVRIIKVAGLIEAIIKDVRRGIPSPRISFKFHRTVAAIITGMCGLIKKDTGIRRVALSGGVFQNRLLQRLVLSDLRKAGYNVLTHRLVPCNDGGLSLGQAVIANYGLR